MFNGSSSCFGLEHVSWSRGGGGAPLHGLSVDSTLVDNDMRHHSGQNVVDSWDALFQGVIKIVTQRKSKPCL